MTWNSTANCRFFILAGMFFASTMVMVTVALVMAVIVTNIYAKKESPERCPQWCIRLALRFYPSVHIPPRSEQIRTPQLGRANPSPVASIDPGIYGTGDRAKRKRKYAGCGGMNVVSTVADAIVAADPYAMHCCAERSGISGGAAFPDESSSSSPSSPSCGCFRPPTSASLDLRTDNKDSLSMPSAAGTAEAAPPRRFQRQAAVGAGKPSTHRQMRQMPPPPPAAAVSCAAASAAADGGFDYATSEAEWRMVAKFTDRVFFWIFLALSTVTHCSLFMQMSPDTRELMML